MDKKARYQELLQKRKVARIKLDRAMKALDHPHGQWQSSHDLAESDSRLWNSYLEDLEKEIAELESALGR